MSYEVMDVAQFIINYSKDNNISITNLKLQKLLYYIQAAFLVEKNEACFEESIINWRHGPVVQEIYDEFRNYGSGEIDYLEKYFKLKIKDDLKLEMVDNYYSDNPIKNASNQDSRIIKKVIDAYKSIDNAWKIVKKTHEEDPWKFSERNEEITKESILEFFNKNKERIYSDGNKRTAR